MDIQTIIVLVLIGLAAGILGGMIGLGGGIIIIPALVLFLSLDQKTAQGTSIAIMLPPIGLLAAYNYYKEGYINIGYALLVALGFFIGGYFGSKFAIMMPVNILKKVFACLLIAMSIKLLFFDK